MASSTADFWAGYLSGAIGILVGNPLDLIKTRLQAGTLRPSTTASPATVGPSKPLPAPHWTQQFTHWSTLARGAAAPILGSGALNALLFVTYNRSLSLLTTGDFNSSSPSSTALHANAAQIWTAGALGGLAIFFVSAPTELVKCRAQVGSRSSWEVTKELWRARGVRGLYLGGGVTAVRDSVGYGFYFWSYHLSKQAVVRENDSAHVQALKIMLCGGLAGVVTWASIFPLDVIKTRVQTWDLLPPATPLHSEVMAGRGEAQTLLPAQHGHSKSTIRTRPSTLHIARQAYEAEGVAVFFRGLGICSARAFFVNAVQWAVYEWTMNILSPQ